MRSSIYSECEFWLPPAEGVSEFHFTFIGLSDALQPQSPFCLNATDLKCDQPTTEIAPGPTSHLDLRTGEVGVEEGSRAQVTHLP